MNADHSGKLRNGVALVFRVGTVIAMSVIAVGYGVSLAVGSERGEGSLVTQLAAGGPTAIIAAGLFALTLLPMGVVLALIVGFARSGERGRALTALGVLVLLVASLVTASLLAPSG